MLGPALRRLLDELAQFNPKQRSNFENQLVDELSGLDQSLNDAQRLQEGVQRIGAGVHRIQAIEGPLRLTEAFKSLSAVQSDIDDMMQLRLHVDIGEPPAQSGGLGSGNVPINLATTCSRPDCPNKRDK